MKGKRITGNFL